MGNQQGKERRDYGTKIDWTNAERPSPPGKPYLVPEEGDRHTDIITIRWSPPTTDGGAPVIGYLVEHRRTGSPHWLRAIPDLVIGTQLPLTGLEPGWRYQFRVSAENEVGRSDPGELSEPLTVTPQKWAACAPFFNIELEDTIGLENEKVEFKVQVVAVPPATISWYKDGFEVFSSRRTKIVTENDQSMFVIHQAALEDEGEIKCTATNRAGHAVTKANLKLEAPPRIRLPRKYEDGLIFEKGELIRLKVTTAGRPKPQVLWYHNGELLQKNTRVEISDSETGSMVRIVDACREDRGEYVIKGLNKIGEDIASFLVTVIDKPLPPSKPHITIFGRQVTLTWSSPEDDGGCKIGSYIIEYFRIGWDMWLKAKNSRQLSTTLDDLIEGSEYKFRVRAENPYGISEPSEESDIIFIPDPKRGIFKPPPRKETPEVLKETKRHAVNQDNEKETEEVKRRRILEEKAKKLLDTPLSVLLPYENKNEVKDENIPPPVPKRRKGKIRPPSSSNSSDRSRVTTSPSLSDRSLLTSTPSLSDASFASGSSANKSPSPSNFRKQINTPSPRIDRKPMDTPSPRINRNQMDTPSPRVDRKQQNNLNLVEDNRVKLSESIKDKKESPVPNGTIKSSEWTTKSAELRRSGQFMFDEKEPNENESPMYPRESDDTIMHGSSELMLVIYPRDRSKSELSAQQRSEIELNLTSESVAPPMSLSAPELGCAEIYEQPLARNAISSTELLHELTAARLYQDSVNEEAQRKLKRRYSMDRRSVERRASLKEPLEKRWSWKDETKPNQTHLEPPTQTPQKEKSPKPEEYQSTITKPKSTPTAKERMSSVERERLEFALVRERLKKKEEEKQRFAANNESDTPTTTTTATSSSADDLDEEDEYEDDEYLEEEEEEDYLDLKNKKQEEDEEFDMEDDIRQPIVQKLILPRPIRIAPHAEQEEDTYHPRSMIPTRSVMTKLEKPEIKEPTKEPLKQAPPTPEAEKEESPPKVSKIPVPSEKKHKKTSKILKKFGLKKDKKVIPEVTLTPADPNSPPAVVPKPILKNKTLPRRKDSPKTLLKLGIKPTDKSISEEESEGEFPGKKKKVRIATPTEEEELKKKVEKIDENARENQILILHYSDIVKEFGGNKKPPTRLYLNYDELKAHAKPEVPTEKINSLTKPKESKSRSVSPVNNIQKKDVVLEKKTPTPTGSRPVTPTGSRPATPSGSKPVTPTGSRPVTPTGSRPVTPTTLTTSSFLEEAKPQSVLKSRTSMEYITDVVMFLIACWLYLFKNELYAIPVLCVMAYRQLKDITVEKYSKLKGSISKMVPEKLKGKTENAQPPPK